jgi:ribosomal protein S12 methylthiotransferase
MMHSVFFCNMGCSKNMVDGEVMLAHLGRSGYTITDNPAVANVIVVNTCAFIEAAKIEAIDKILEMASFKKTGLCTKLVVCGCFSQRFRETAAHDFPEVDIWAGMDDWLENFAMYLDATAQPSFVRHLEEPRATQYLKIAEGCSHKCAFCAIPLIKGEFRSRKAIDIIKEALWLADQGVKECILVAQDSSFYGKDTGTSLAELLEELLAETPFPWIRVMYLHPVMVDDKLLRLFAAQPRLCPYFDIPLQHASDAVLMSMRRRPLSMGIRALIGHIRATVPGAAIRTAFIAGFPGETEAHFEELINFVNEMKFDKVGVFSFSAEEGTAAFSMRPRPQASTVSRRCETLMSIQREISAEINKSRIDNIYDVIVDGESDVQGFSCMGRTRLDAPEVDGNVYIKGSKIQAGSIVPIKIYAADEYDLFGEPA